MKGDAAISWRDLRAYADIDVGGHRSAGEQGVLRRKPDMPNRSEPWPLLQTTTGRGNEGGAQAAHRGRRKQYGGPRHLCGPDAGQGRNGRGAKLRDGTWREGSQSGGGRCQAGRLGCDGHSGWRRYVCGRHHPQPGGGWDRYDPCSAGQGQAQRGRPDNGRALRRELDPYREGRQRRIFHPPTSIARRTF